MKQLFIATIIIACALSAKGQLPEWIIPAECKTLDIKANRIVEGTVGVNHNLWNMDGKRLFSTVDKIHDFSNDVATIQIANTNKLSGFVDTEGNFIELPQVEIAYDYPYFEDNFLVAKQNGNYVMFHKIGEEINLPAILTLYPYSNGFATFFAYQQPEKKKNPYFNLLMADGNPIKNFVIKENDKTKVVEPKDISFMSTVGSDTWRALAVVKNKLYWFDTFEMYLIPIMIEEDNKKKQLVLESGKTLSMTEFPTDSFTITAKYGKDKTIDFKFDKLLRLMPNNGNTPAPKGPNNPFTPPTFSSTLSTYSEGNYMGLINAQNDTIPAQFEEIGLRYDNKAFAKMNGKWGVIELIPDCDYSISINDGEDISFEHHATDTKLKIELPSRIDADKVTIDFPKSSGIHIDKASRVAINSDKGNQVAYNCTLEIPLELTDTISTTSYGLGTVTVDNVRLPSRNIHVNAKYENNFSIDIPNTNAHISNGEVAFEIRIQDNNAKKYPYEFSFVSKQFIDSQAIVTSHQRLEENCYICFVNVSDLRAGFNQFEIEITEEGCPTLTFPIQIDYSNVRKKEKATIVDLSKEQNIEESLL
ncbi:MAG: WG repeat-containing protein [Muribaculaceae bacterium]|nr:WG repeat-containing protein [Muribaculaceae bacterium]